MVGSPCFRANSGCSSCCGMPSAPAPRVTSGVRRTVTPATVAASASDWPSFHRGQQLRRRLLLCVPLPSRVQSAVTWSFTASNGFTAGGVTSSTLSA